MGTPDAAEVPDDEGELRRVQINVGIVDVFAGIEVVEVAELTRWAQQKHLALERLSGAVAHRLEAPLNFEDPAPMLRCALAIPPQRAVLLSRLVVAPEAVVTAGKD